MKEFLRKHGPYAGMLLGTSLMQCFMAYGRAGQVAGAGADQAGAIQHLTAQAGSARMPSLFFFIMAAVLFVFGLGLVFDTIYFMRWMLARSAGQPLLRTGPGRSGPWEAADAAKLFVIFFFALSCAHLLLVLFSWETAALFVSSLAVYAVVLATLTVWLRVRGVRAWPAVNWANIRLGFSAYFAFVPLLAVLLFASLLICQTLGVAVEPHELVHILREERDTLRIIFIVALSVFAGPVMEEILFRWVTYGALRKKLGVVGAACGSAALFAMAHTNAAQALPIFGMGVVLALLYEHTGSLAASIAFHMLNNGLALILTLAVVHGGM